jgi:hypothetical protein
VSQEQLRDYHQPPTAMLRIVNTMMSADVFLLQD